MTPQAFIAHWQNNDITERAGAQQHFNDLCEMLGQEKPRDAENYCFERGAKTQGGQGWADVWKRGCFAWEYKAPGCDLAAALKQLMNYALALDNPPLLVVCDLRNIEIHTHFTGHPSIVHRIPITDLTQPETRQKLIWLFTEPDRFKPSQTTFAVTEQAAKRMGDIAERLNKLGNTPQEVAHFLIQCVFCMFAEDARLLPEKLFETVLDRSNPDGAKAQSRLTELFTAMQKGGDFAMHDIPWFNGGLFENIKVPALQTVDVVNLLEAARMNWSQIEPAILGTLFERGLNPDMRSQLGAHYTDPATIMKIILPVVEQPLLAEWQPIKKSIAGNMTKYQAGGKGSQVAFAEAQKGFLGFLERLRNYRVLDTACGSGNFLYLALKTLKDLEHRVNLEAEALGLHRELNIEVSPANVLGIEINPYAAELARITVWIGEIQWMLGHGYSPRKDPILAPLDHIENRDAILNLPPQSGEGGGEGAHTQLGGFGNFPLPTGEGQGEGANPQFSELDKLPLPAGEGWGEGAHHDIPPQLIEYARELRKSQTDAENLVWMLLRDRRFLGCKFRRQHPLPPYILDFYCHEKKLAIELDGGQHAEQQGYDQKRDQFLKDQGIRVLRFWNNDVLNRTESVLEALYSALTPTPLPSGEGLTSGTSLQIREGPASEVEWPECDAIVGNPPFLGDKKMISELGETYVKALRSHYKGAVPGGADLVTYWFEKARVHIAQGKAKLAGLVATNSIRQKRNRPVLERILNTVIPAQAGIQNGNLSIYEAWSDEEWVNAGAAVRVSLVAFGITNIGAMLDGQPVAAIHADLTAGDGLNLTQARPLKENASWSYFGLCLAGPFKVTTTVAHDWLRLPNPHGRPNSEVLKPIYNGSDITRRWAGNWAIDFGLMDEQQAALYEAPFAYAIQHVKPVRATNREAIRVQKWWRHGRPRPELRTKLVGLQRYIATPETAKHRFFVWFPISVAPEHSLIVIPHDSDTTFGILSSRFHTLWALMAGGRMGYGNDPRYNSSVTFETFPFPEGCTPSSPALLPEGEGSPEKEGSSDPSPDGRGWPTGRVRAEAIALAAKRLDELRNNWLNPPEWVDWVITPEEEKAGYPKRPVAKPGFEAELKKRTLTNLYNQRPAWLDNIHKELDKAVADAYGWGDYTAEMPDEEILRCLLVLNLQRSEAEKTAATAAISQ